MRKEEICMYSTELDKEIEREFEIYKRDEFIEYVQENNIKLNEYYLELSVPRFYSCTIETMKRLEDDDELFIFEEDKIIYLYLN